MDSPICPLWHVEENAAQHPNVFPTKEDIRNINQNGQFDYNKIVQENSDLDRLCVFRTFSKSDSLALRALNPMTFK